MKLKDYNLGFYLQCETVDPADVDKLATTVKRALQTYGTPVLKEMIQNCMAQDFSWKVIIQQLLFCSLHIEESGYRRNYFSIEIRKYI